MKYSPCLLPLILAGSFFSSGIVMAIPMEIGKKAPSERYAEQEERYSNNREEDTTIHYNYERTALTSIAEEEGGAEGNSTLKDMTLLDQVIQDQKRAYDFFDRTQGFMTERRRATYQSMLRLIDRYVKLVECSLSEEDCADKVARLHKIVDDTIADNACFFEEFTAYCQRENLKTSANIARKDFKIPGWPFPSAR